MGWGSPQDSDQAEDSSELDIVIVEEGNQGTETGAGRAGVVTTQEAANE